MAYDYSGSIAKTAGLNAGNAAIDERRNEQAYLGEIARQRKERERAEHEQKSGWWKRMLGNAAGMGLGALGAGLGMSAGPVGMALGAGLGGGLGGGIAEALGGSSQSANAGIQLGGMAAQQQAAQQRLPGGQGRPSSPMTQSQYNSSGKQPYYNYWEYLNQNYGGPGF